MGLLANKMYQLLGRRSFKPMFAYLGVIMVPLLLFTVLPRERCGIWWVTAKMLVSLSVEAQTVQ